MKHQAEIELRFDKTTARKIRPEQRTCDNAARAVVRIGRGLPDTVANRRAVLRDSKLWSTVEKEIGWDQKPKPPQAKRRSGSA